MKNNSNTNDAPLSNSPFSDEIPQLLEKHLEHLKASAIPIDVIRERGYNSVLGKKILKEAGFTKAQQRYPGILIPLHGVDGSIIGYQFRPDEPRLNVKGKPVKYENPTGSSVRLDVPLRCREQLGNPQIPIWFTEGIKKVDALASHGACAIGLTGVWGFKGRNPLGGTTILADFDYLTLRDRTAYLAFDSDSSSNPQVRSALQRLAEHLERKGANVKALCLPSGPQGEKVGVDDYLAGGHSLSDLSNLVSEQLPGPPPKKVRHAYIIEEGRVCWRRPTVSGEIVTPLCNFDAKATEDLVKDNGIELLRFFVIEGRLANGKVLPPVQLPANRFNSMSWIAESWGMQAIIAAGITLKDRLREAIQLQSQGATHRKVYTHTGWRVIEGKPSFLTASGALGLLGIEVELDTSLQRYSLPIQLGDDKKEAIQRSLDFLNIGKAEVTIPLWAAMYLAPLSQVVDPAFTLWLIGPTGTFKSTMQALAISHFGAFTVRTLPASWRDTANYLGKLMALAKDIPLVIDDWAPAPDTKQAREYEAKAEQVARAQANRIGRGRLRSDTTTRPAYIPRGVLLSNGEQLPSGQSHTARLFSCEIEPGDIDLEKLTSAQDAAQFYPTAMAGYISWLANQWDELQKELPLTWKGWRQQAQSQGKHPRVPEAVAWLYSAFDMGMAFAEEMGVVNHSQSQERRSQAWDTLIELGDMQGGRVEEERPGHRFVVGLRALMDEGKVEFPHKDEEAAKTSPFATQIGWRDSEGILYLNPPPAYTAVYDFWRRSGEPLTFKANTVWKDLKRLGLTICDQGRTSTTAWVVGNSRRVVRLKKDALRDV